MFRDENVWSELDMGAIHIVRTGSGGGGGTRRPYGTRMGRGRGLPHPYVRSWHASDEDTEDERDGPRFIKENRRHIMPVYRNLFEALQNPFTDM